MRDLAAFTLPIFPSKMRHRFTLELDFSRTAVQIATKTCPVHFHHRSAMLLLIKLFFVRFGNFLLLAMMVFRTAYIIRKPFV